jgi:hypothetical protein
MGNVGAPHQSQSEPIVEYLRRLNEQYIELVNCAVDEGRDDLAQQFADAYADEALRAITEAESRPR